MTARKKDARVRQRLTLCAGALLTLPLLYLIREPPARIRYLATIVGLGAAALVNERI
jgi:hypothetical protein